MASMTDENPRGKIEDLLNKFDNPNLQFILRHMLTFRDFIFFNVSGSLRNSRQRISDLLNCCDDSLLAFFLNQFLVFRNDVQRIISSGDRDNAKTHRQNLDYLLDQAEEGDLIEFEHIISSYVSIEQATADGREENPRQIISSLLDKLDAASLSAVLQHLLIMWEHGVPHLPFHLGYPSRQETHFLIKMGELILHQIEAIYYPTLAAFGVPVNAVAIVILSRGKCGLSKCVTCYMMAMAATDLLVVCTDVILTSTLDIYCPSSFFTMTPVCCLTLTLSYVFTSASVWLTVMFTLDRFVAICCEKRKKKYCTEKTAAAVITVVSVLSCLINIPWYFAYEPENIVDNVNHGCVLKQTFIISAEWAAFDLFTLTLTPCVPFILILLLNVLMVRRILVANKVRRGLHVCSNGEHHKDSEIESRRKSMILLFSISSSFILLWATLVVYFISLHTTIISYSGLYKLESVAYMLVLLNCCTNTFIYVLTQAKFREELKNGMWYLKKLFVKLFKS